MNFLWWSKESQSVGDEGVSRCGGAGRWIFFFSATNEELKHALVLDLSAPVASLTAVLLRDSV